MNHLEIFSMLHVSLPELCRTLSQMTAEAKGDRIADGSKIIIEVRVMNVMITLTSNHFYDYRTLTSTIIQSEW